MRFIRVRLCFFVLLSILISCGIKTYEQPYKDQSSGAGTDTLIPKPQGWDVGGGGNAFVAEFTDIGRALIKRWKGLSKRMIGEVSPEMFEEAFERAVVITTDQKLFREGQEVDAINYPDRQEIFLSLSRWSKNMPFTEKRRLVIHEVLGLLRKEASLHYTVTSQIIRELDFFRELPIHNFDVTAKTARILIEKLNWLPGEVSIEEISNQEGGQPTIRRTYYTLPVSEEPREGLKCRKVEDLDPKTKQPTHVYERECEITGNAYVSDEPSIRLFLNSGGKLYKRFFPNNERSFDYGLVKGEVDSNSFPIISIYFDR